MRTNQKFSMVMNVSSWTAAFALALGAIGCGGSSTVDSEGTGGGTGGQGGAEPCVSCAEKLAEGDGPPLTLCPEAEPPFDDLHACVCGAGGQQGVCEMADEQWCIGGPFIGSACLQQNCATEYAACQQH